MNPNHANRSLRTLTFCALLVAMSIVFSRVLSISTGFLRFNLGSLPVVLAAVLFGPGAGFVVGAVADAIGGVLAGYAINPLITLGAGAVGFFAGWGWRHLPARTDGLRLAGGILLGHIVGSMMLNSLALRLFYGYAWAVLGRPHPQCAGAGRSGVRPGAGAAGQPRFDGGRPRRPHREAFLMDYQEALAYIHAVHWQGHKPGLDRIRTLLAALGDPHRQLRFVHVARTPMARAAPPPMLDSCLRCAGYRVGLFTSPYINRFNERIQVDGVPIPRRGPGPPGGTGAACRVGHGRRAHRVRAHHRAGDALLCPDPLRHRGAGSGAGGRAGLHQRDRPARVRGHHRAGDGTM